MSREEQFDFYWKEIFDGLSYNPIEFNVYRFGESMSLPTKFNKLYDMFKQLALNNQEVMDYLKEFVETFDSNLYTTVTDVLNVWLDEGRLADIMLQINDKIIEFELEYNARLNDLQSSTRKNVLTIDENNLSTLEATDNSEIFLQHDILLTEPIIIKDLNNIYFNAPVTIKISPDFNSTHKYFIKFENCNNVRVNIALLDGDNVILYPSDGSMNFPILFEDCTHVVIDNVRAENCMKIGGLSSTINAVNKKKVGKYFTVKNLYVENCRSAIFTQYSNNTIENVKAIHTNDAIIAINSENSKNTYINNCYANYNDAFPLVAIENMATEIIVENCIARNTRGLFELFSLDIPIVNAQPKSHTNLIIRNSRHIIDDSNFNYNPTVSLQTLSLRRTVEKYESVIIENVELINLTTNNKCAYLYLNSEGVSNERLNQLKVINPKMITKSNSDYGMLINDNIDEVVIDNIYFKAQGVKIGFAIRHSARIKIKNITLKDGYVENFNRFISNDLLDNKGVYELFRMENVRTSNVDVLIYNIPNGNISLVEYIRHIFNKYDYVLTNTGSTIVRYEADRVPPLIGTNFKGDIAYNLNNSFKYYYNGTTWIKTIIDGISTTTGQGAPTYIPDQIGNLYISTNTNKLYFAVGKTSVSDWILVN